MEARVHQGQWRLRIDDLDVFRTSQGISDDIIETLACHGLHWDGPIVYQNQQTSHYQEALDTLSRQGLIYTCACSRKSISRVARRGRYGLVYPGTCRHLHLPQVGNALRIQVSHETIRIDDQLQGHFSQQLSTDIGDFVIKRRDGIFAYQLAVVVDDALMGVTHVVRGADLLDNTPRQVYLQRLLNLPEPRYLHLPLLVDPAGQKLSKQTQAKPVERKQAVENLMTAWSLLGQAQSNECPSSVDEFYRWAIPQWSARKVPRGPVSLIG